MASFNFVEKTTSAGLSLVNEYESTIPTLAMNVDWYANAYLVTYAGSLTSWNIFTRLGYAKLNSDGTVNDVHWVLYGTQEYFASPATYNAYLSKNNINWTQFSGSELWDGSRDACATTDKAVGSYCASNPDELYGIKSMYSLTTTSILSRSEVRTAMSNGYTHLCLYSTGVDSYGNPINVSYNSTVIPYIDLNALNTYGFGWLTQATSFSQSLKVKVREGGEHKWKSVTSAYVNVVEYDEEDNPTSFWKPIDSAKVKSGGSWKTLQTGIGAVTI